MDTSLGLSSLPFLLTRKGTKQARHRFLTLDTETTGLNRRRDRLVQAAAVLFEDGERKESFSTFFRSPVENRAENINHITAGMIALAPEEGEALDALLSFLGRNGGLSGVPVVGHNVGFDLGFLAEAMKRNGRKANLSFLDTLSLSRLLLPSPNYRQTTLASLLKIPNPEAHRADGDALVCGSLFLRLLSLYEGRMKEGRTKDSSRLLEEARVRLLPFVQRLAGKTDFPYWDLLWITEGKKGRFSLGFLKEEAEVSFSPEGLFLFLPPEASVLDPSAPLKGRLPLCLLPEGEKNEAAEVYFLRRLDRLKREILFDDRGRDRKVLRASFLPPFFPPEKEGPFPSDRVQ